MSLRLAHARLLAFRIQAAGGGALASNAALKTALCTSAAGVIANSRATAAHLPCRRKVRVVHNGIEVGCFDPMMEGRSAGRGTASPPSTLVPRGTAAPWKGQARFLRCCPRAL